MWHIENFASPARTGSGNTIGRHLAHPETGHGIAAALRNIGNRALCSSSTVEAKVADRSICLDIVLLVQPPFEAEF